MPPEPIIDEEYASEEDSDFALDDAPAEDESASEDDEAADTEKPATGKRKQQAEDGADDAGFENSGDEAVIEKGKKRQRKSKGKGGEADEDEGGEGGLIKTRRMRAAEKAERRADTSIGPVTIDVDALWAQMTSDSSTSKPPTGPAAAPQLNADTPSSSQPQPPTETKPDESNLIRIKRTYNFAGKVHTEEKLVARDSAEAKLYLAENGLDSGPPISDDASSSPPKRMPRKAFRSLFEPVAADGGLSRQRADLNLCVSERLRARELLMAKADAKKLNTVEKSRMDWAGFVDREGIQDELALAGKSKHSFAARQEFLARSEAVREEEVRRARVAGRG